MSLPGKSSILKNSQDEKRTKSNIKSWIKRMKEFLIKEIHSIPLYKRLRKKISENLKIDRACLWILISILSTNLLISVFYLNRKNRYHILQGLFYKTVDDRALPDKRFVWAKFALNKISATCF